MRSVRRIEALLGSSTLCAFSGLVTNGNVNVCRFVTLIALATLAGLGLSSEARQIQRGNVPVAGAGSRFDAAASAAQLNASTATPLQQWRPRDREPIALPGFRHRRVPSHLINEGRVAMLNDVVEVALDGGHHVVAVVTHESATGLGLKAGAKAFVLIKASSVIVVADLGTARLSARNQFSRTVARVQPGAVNAEIVIDIGHGVSIAAIITQESALSLGLPQGSAATAIIKASSVVVGVPD